MLWLFIFQNIVVVYIKIQYNKKFKIFCSDGKLSRVGPGYDINHFGEIVITNHNIYHEHVDKVLAKEKKPVKMTQKFRRFLKGFFVAN
jgi:hypothetical protein